MSRIPSATVSRLVTYLRIVAREDRLHDSDAAPRARRDALRAQRAERRARELHRDVRDPQEAEKRIREAVLDELEAAQRERRRAIRVRTAEREARAEHRGAPDVEERVRAAVRKACEASPDEPKDPTISSGRLAEEAQASAFQVRKDLAYFGRFGTRGAGYAVPVLHAALLWILNLTRPWRVAIVGMGRLGAALVDYPDLSEYAFELVAGFDEDDAKIDRRIGEIPVHGVADLPAIVRARGIDIAFLTVPRDAAQEAADAVVAAGVTGILNFAPTVIEVPDHVRVEPVDFLAGLKRLSFYIQEPEVEEEIT